MTDEGLPAAHRDARAKPGSGSPIKTESAVVEALCVAAGDGRLTAAELDERLEAALTARVMSDLTPLDG